MKLHLPLFKSIFAAFGLLFLVMVLEKREFYFLWFFAFFLYTHFFEYVYHKGLLHKNIISAMWKSHMTHHFNLRGETFASKDPEKLKETLTSMRAYAFLFFIHLLLFTLFFSNKYAVSAFSGITLCFAFYQTTHWFSHTKGSILYKIAEHIPAIAHQIEHHRIHHNNFVVNFNFCMPYLGDRIFGTYEKRRK